ncbi:DNA adenine methylase [Luteolibacter sp. AS25]|uniref:DNA adenine methylase n=1 Tax=Luteolibacter sp. AS25 TaxID=3135776 RepID=UPI00398ACE15
MLEPKPFLRWVGGKGWIAPLIKRISEVSEHSIYIEPFLGSGAIFFSLRPSRAILCDVNKELISAFEVVVENPEIVFTRLSRMPISATDYYLVRESKPRSKMGIALRFLYLNRLAYGGIYRVNKDGMFNVPYGKKFSFGDVISRSNLCSSRDILRAAIIRSQDFRATLSKVPRSSLIYVDPVYTSGKSERFDRYTKESFSMSDHQDLANLVTAAVLEKNATAIVSLPYDINFSTLYIGGLWVGLQRGNKFGIRKEKNMPYMELIWIGSAFESNSDLLRIIRSFKSKADLKILGFTSKMLSERTLQSWRSRANTL